MRRKRTLKEFSRKHIHIILCTLSAGFILCGLVMLIQDFYNSTYAPDTSAATVQEASFSSADVLFLSSYSRSFITVPDQEKGMLKGVVTAVTFLGVHYEIIVDINGFKWMIQTTDFVDVDEHIGLYIEPDAIHIMKKSEYSGMYGDYSSFSNELDELSDAESEMEE